MPEAPGLKSQSQSGYRRGGTLDATRSFSISCSSSSSPSTYSFSHIELFFSYMFEVSYTTPTQWFRVGLYRLNYKPEKD